MIAYGNLPRILAPGLVTRQTVDGRTIVCTSCGRTINLPHIVGGVDCKGNES